ncbi:hypothetical protein QAD02_018206 [Eretmocerus hayati]|uniref:Uncharacterized protein n=1 Tax=Eretmocerus hayati TaxID=131215 RepID=A0ACC2PIJ6_9HYME|nr:hypothetical protein QAD02_018206 [Eretmocerus hayati]
MGVQLFLFIVTVLLVNWPICEAAEDRMDHLLNYIREEMSVFKVNIITPTSGDRTPLVDEIIQGTNQNFVSNNLNYDNLTLIQDPVLLEDRMKIYGFEKIFERNALTMGIIECKNGSSVMRDMFTMLKYFHALNPLTRGKYILNLITKERVNLTSFFQRAWSQAFLDLTVLEWIQKSANSFVTARMISNSTAIERVIVHSFNPFNNTINREILMQHTVIFPNKVKDLHKFPLVVYNAAFFDPSSEYISLIENFCWSLNCELRQIGEPESEETFGSEIPEIVADLLFPHMSLISAINGRFKNECKIGDYYWHHFLAVQLPITKSRHFYLRRRKTYEQNISFAALATFGGLFFTAWLFATWTILLKFKQRNWSFLNILTAQMGSSIEHQGRMKLSERIYQMSIYIATLMIVTIGSDYMYQIFILHPTLPEITTIRDLADSNINLTMDFSDYTISRQILSNMIDNDSSLSKIFNITWSHEKMQESDEFCKRIWSAKPILDESINLCIDFSTNDELIIRSDKQWKIDKIQEPIVVDMQVLLLGRISFYKDPLQTLIYKYAQIGLMKKWGEAVHAGEYEHAVRANYSTVKIDENEEMPLQEQLQPVLLIGYIFGAAVLIFEFIWKYFIEKTELGGLVNAFYRDSRQSSATRGIKTWNPTMSVPQKLNVKILPWKFDDEQTQISARESLKAPKNNVHRVEVVAAEIHHHSSKVGRAMITE